MLQNSVLIYCDRLARAEHKSIVGMVDESVGGREGGRQRRVSSEGLKSFIPFKSKADFVIRVPH